MRLREPPPRATWMLEHLTPGDRDEALAGDLLEEYCRGRSEGWYWRQVMAACAVSWLKSLQARLPLLAFTLLWSLLAPAWNSWCDKVENAPIFDKIWRMAGGVWIFPALAVWMVLHSALLWTGILVYVLSYWCLGKMFQREGLQRAFLLVPLIFSPIYGATLVLGNLYWWDIFAGAKLATTPMGQVADLGMLADTLRIPYIIAMLCALWERYPNQLVVSKIHLGNSLLLSHRRNQAHSR